MKRKKFTLNFFFISLSILCIFFCRRHIISSAENKANTMIETIFITGILVFGGYWDCLNHFGWLLGEKLMIMSNNVKILMILYGFRVLAIFLRQKNYISGFYVHFSLKYSGNKIWDDKNPPFCFSNHAISFRILKNR